MPSRGRPGRDALITELTDMLDRLQGFCRLLSLEPPAGRNPGLVPRRPPADVARGRPVAATPDRDRSSNLRGATCTSEWTPFPMLWACRE